MSRIEQDPVDAIFKALGAILIVLVGLPILFVIYATLKVWITGDTFIF